MVRSTRFSWDEDDFDGFQAPEPEPVEPDDDWLDELPPEPTARHRGPDDEPEDRPRHLADADWLTAPDRPARSGPPSRRSGTAPEDEPH